MQAGKDASYTLEMTQILMSFQNAPLECVCAGSWWPFWVMRVLGFKINLDPQTPSDFLGQAAQLPLAQLLCPRIALLPQRTLSLHCQMYPPSSASRRLQRHFILSSFPATIYSPSSSLCASLLTEFPLFIHKCSHQSCMGSLQLHAGN